MRVCSRSSQNPKVVGKKWLNEEKCLFFPTITRTSELVSVLFHSCVIMVQKYRAVEE